MTATFPSNSPIRQSSRVGSAHFVPPHNDTNTAARQAGKRPGSQDSDAEEGRGGRRRTAPAAPSPRSGRRGACRPSASRCSGARPTTAGSAAPLWDSARRRSGPPTYSGASRLCWCSQYRRADDVIVCVTQYVITFVISWSRVKTFSGSPSQSLHARNFSTIHASSPAGESLSATPSVCGLRRLLLRVARLLARELLRSPRGRPCPSSVSCDRLVGRGPRSAC